MPGVQTGTTGRDAQQHGPRRRGHREGRRRLGSAAELLDACAGTGAFWNFTTRLLDGFKLLSAPETGISIDASVVNCLSPGLAILVAQLASVA